MTRDRSDNPSLPQDPDSTDERRHPSQQQARCQDDAGGGLRPDRYRSWNLVESTTVRSDSSWSFGRVVLALIPASTRYMALALGSAAFSLQEEFVDDPGVVDSDVRPVYDFASPPVRALSSDWGGDLPEAIRRDTDWGCALLATALEKTGQSSGSIPHLYDEEGAPLVGREEVRRIVKSEDGDESVYWLVPGVVRRHTVAVPDGPTTQLACGSRTAAAPHVFVGRGGAPFAIPELERPIWVCRHCGRPTYGPDPDRDAAEEGPDVIPGPDGTPVQTTLHGGPDAEHERQIATFYDEYGRYPWEDGTDS